jgi:hypothetical protein
MECESGHRRVGGRHPPSSLSAHYRDASDLGRATAPGRSPRQPRLPSRAPRVPRCDYGPPCRSGHRWRGSELAPWDVKGGYSRPICRRIVEERGVPRDMFGVEKKATAQFILRADNFLTGSMRRDYYRWLRSRRRAWLDRGATPPQSPDRPAVCRSRTRRRVDRAFASEGCRQTTWTTCGRGADPTFARHGSPQASRLPAVRISLGSRPSKTALSRPLTYPGRAHFGIHAGSPVAIDRLVPLGIASKVSRYQGT